MCQNNTQFYLLNLLLFNVILPNKQSSSISTSSSVFSDQINEDFVHFYFKRIHIFIYLKTYPISTVYQNKKKHKKMLFGSPALKNPPTFDILFLSYLFPLYLHFT